MDMLRDLLPIAMAAVIAGISAVVKSTYERRDARLTSRLSLELAIARRDFVKDWWAASSSLVDDESGLARARAVEEMERAWEEACTALDSSQQLLAEARRTSLVDQLRSILLLDRRHGVLAWAAVLLYYFVVLTVWLAPFGSQSPSDPDYVEPWVLVLFAAVVTIVLRVVFGLFIHWVERRRRERAARRDDTGAVPPPSTGPATP